MSERDQMEELLTTALSAQYPEFESTPKDLEMTEPQLVGQVGFRSLGGLGSIGIVGDEVNLPLCGMASEGLDYEDWIGELANQTVGRLKRETLPALRDVAVTTPVVLRNVQLRIQNSGSTRVFEMQSEGRLFSIWFDLSGVDLYAQAEENTETPLPSGDSVLFF